MRQGRCCAILLGFALLFSSGDVRGAVIGRITEVLTQAVVTPAGSIGPYVELRIAQIAEPIEFVVLQPRAFSFYVRNVVTIPTTASQRVFIVHQGEWHTPRYDDTIYMRLDSLDLGAGDSARSLVLYDHDTPLSTASTSAQILAEPGIADVVDYTIGSGIGPAFGEGPATALPLGGALLRFSSASDGDVRAAGLVNSSLRFATGEALSPGARDDAITATFPQHTPEPGAAMLVGLAAAITGLRARPGRPCRSAAAGAAAPRRPR